MNIAWQSSSEPEAGPAAFINVTLAVENKMWDKGRLPAGWCTCPAIPAGGLPKPYCPSADGLISLFPQPDKRFHEEIGADFPQ
jgi:hypothetical protein